MYYFFWPIFISLVLVARSIICFCKHQETGGIICMSGGVLIAVAATILFPIA